MFVFPTFRFLHGHNTLFSFINRITSSWSNAVAVLFFSKASFLSERKIYASYSQTIVVIWTKKVYDTGLDSNVVHRAYSDSIDGYWA